MSVEPLRVGLVGAGPWASRVHAKAVAAHPATELTGVWSRRADAAAGLAAEHGAVAFHDVPSMVDAVDVVAFAVPPAVQAELAPAVATAGRHLILEKPIAPDVAAAERLAGAVAGAGVASVIVLTRRFAPETRTWLAEVTGAGGWRGATGRWLSGVLLDAQYTGSAWRHSDGALADVGPHLLDLLDVAVGPIVEVLAAHRTEPDLWQLTLAHDTGAVSSAALSLRLPLVPTITSVEVYGEHGHRRLGDWPTPALDCFATLLDELAGVIRDGGTGHPCDVQRGLHLQRLLDAARALALG